MKNHRLRHANLGLVAALIAACIVPDLKAEPHGLWRSDVDKSTALLTANESVTDEQRKMVGAEFGSLYHYFAGGRFYLIYSSSLSPIEVIKLIESSSLDRLSDSEFAKTFEISDVERKGNHIQLTLDGTKGSSVLVLYLDSKDGCYVVDNNQYGDFVAEVFCRIDGTQNMK